MKDFPVSSLKPGMSFTHEVYVDENNVLVPAHVAVKARDIERLLRWDVSSVRTEGEPEEPAPEEGGGSGASSGQRAGFMQRVFSTAGQRHVTETYNELRDELDAVFVRIRSEQQVVPGQIDHIIDSAFALLGSNRSDTIQYILFGLQGEASRTENALNAAFLSMLLGQRMSMANHKLLQLGTAALLHDAGMLRLPDEIVSKRGALSETEQQQIRTHPVLSYRIATKEIGFSDDVGLGVLQHQERWDGQGYPKGTSGTSIHVYARIIAIADSFEAMVSKRPYRDGMIGYTAIRTILRDNARRFDPEILKVFIRTLGIYPIGSLVLLSDSSIGRVIGTNADAPLRPTVKIMINDRGELYENDDGDIIDLFQQRGLFVARAVNPRDVQANGKK